MKKKHRRNRRPRNKKTGSVHDRTVRNFSNRLKSIEGLIVFRKEFEYNFNGKSGEADSFGIYQRGKRLYAIIGEIKSTDHYKARKKAKYQLNRDIKYIRNFYGDMRFFKFYVTPKITRWLK